MIEAFHRNLKYFEDKVLQSDKTIKANDFDGQFNDIAGYLNAVLKPEIDSIINEALKGKAGNVGEYLHNIGDGSTVWSLLDDDTIDDYLISLDKIADQEVGAILTTDDFGYITTLARSAANEVLVSRADDMPIWKLLENNDIGIEVLTGKQFGILLAENFVENTFLEEFIPDEIVTDEIKDLTIQNSKIKDVSIGEEQLGVFTNLPSASSLNTLKTINIAEGAITDDKIKDYSIPVTFKGSSVGGYELWANEYGITEDEYQHHKYKQLLTNDNILDKSIDDEQLRPIKLTGQVSEVDKESLFNDIPVNFQFQGKHVALDCIKLEYFDAEVQSAINRIINS